MGVDDVGRFSISRLGEGVDVLRRPFNRLWTTTTRGEVKKVLRLNTPPPGRSLLTAEIPKKKEKKGRPKPCGRGEV